VKLWRIPGVDVERVRRLGLSASIFSLALVGFLLLGAHGTELGTFVEKAQQTSTHFNGNVYFNPEVTLCLCIEQDGCLHHGGHYTLTNL
jgi:hypothetical protein